MTYPTNIPTFTTKTDNVDYPQAADVNDLQNNLSGVMNALDTNFGGSTPAQGDILYRSSSGEWTRLAAGTSGLFLKTQGAAANPTWYSIVRYVPCFLNGTTALTTSEKVYFRIPSELTGMDLISVTGSVGTGAAGSSSSGNPTFTVKNVTDSNQMLSTSLTIDANEYTSASAAVPVVIDTTKDDVVTDDLIEVAVTTSGTGVTYAIVTLGFRLP